MTGGEHWLHFTATNQFNQHPWVMALTPGPFPTWAFKAKTSELELSMLRGPGCNPASDVIRLASGQPDGGTASLYLAYDPLADGTDVCFRVRPKSYTMRTGYVWSLQ
jgi:hypothetical protein